jgi:hypothetical protein
MTASFLMTITNISGTHPQGENLVVLGLVQFGSVKLGESVSLSSLGRRTAVTQVIDGSDKPEKGSLSKLTLQDIANFELYEHGYITSFNYCFQQVYRSSSF